MRAADDMLRRNLDVLRKAEWDLLVSRAHEWRTEGIANWVLDNCAWSDAKAGRQFDADAFERLINSALGLAGLSFPISSLVVGAPRRCRYDVRTAACQLARWS
jgi:hypothetical protein